jgi:hypothetical protein
MNVTENVCLAYFADRAKHVKPSSLWSEYSIVYGKVFAADKKKHRP